MRPYDDERLLALAAQLERDDPRFARQFRRGRPTRPREYRRTGAWWALAAALASVAAGVALPHGLLLAAGLVLAGIGLERFDPYR
ncbi:DUF3040 domain-containing protein [Streptomyces leeuwenhoekii]|jgi:hypothetical protein|uniref:DUF3040 domain-containing protein n=1 Tax=Streptomyces leeuwenhoekii TaxID=1437453 RepID=A0A0F7W824_STRLW|nr:DUF3040 domain-containing protein [Streptomyces leeuwenhoekii]CQR66037.1 Hypothetical Protein sle_65830 [Streptomyces leeuwenhoekii]